MRLQPIVQQNVVTYATVIDVPNPELKLKPGMTANVNVEIARRADVLRVPNTALRFRPSNDMYAAFGQTPPPAGRGDERWRTRGAGAAMRSDGTAAAPAAGDTGRQRRQAARTAPARPSRTATGPPRARQRGRTDAAEGRRRR